MLLSKLKVDQQSARKILITFNTLQVKSAVSKVISEAYYRTLKYARFRAAVS